MGGIPPKIMYKADLSSTKPEILDYLNRYLISKNRIIYSNIETLPNTSTLLARTKCSIWYISLLKIL